MRIILSHPTSNENNRAAAMGLYKAGILSEFHTSVASFPGTIFDKVGRLKPFDIIARRRFDVQLKSVIHTRPWLEIGRNIALKGGFSSFTRHESGIFSVDAVYRDLDKYVSARISKTKKSHFDAVYSYEDGAIFSFREARRNSLKCFYDLPIGYWRSARKLLKPELKRWPEWASTIVNFNDSLEKLASKDEELLLANRIIVASSFTAMTLKDFPGQLAPVSVIPYGFPYVSKDAYEKKQTINKPLKLLFVGGLSQRKGIANLFSAVDKLLPYVNLTVVGRKVTNDCPALNKALSKHTWFPSLPHKEILCLMRTHDLLVFPSLFEGFGLVITEAMSQGTPVITTNRTAGPDLIKNGENGWLVDAGSTLALVEGLIKLLDKPILIKEAGEAAMETARNRSWEVYGRELAEVLQKEQY